MPTHPRLAGPSGALLTLLRQMVRRAPRVAMLLVFAALAMRLIVPTGYMIDPASRDFQVRICSGMGAVETVSIAFDADSEGAAPAKAEPCPASLADPAMAGGTDAALLAVALAFILLLALVAPRLALPCPAAHLRPPLRAPPFAS